MIYTDDPNPCRNTFTFTINVKETREYQVALYFVDWDNRERKLAVEMFDASSLNLIAPVKVVKNFNGGKYLIFTYNKSAKFRIDQVRGDNAVLSGIFFDSPASDTTITDIVHVPVVKDNNENPFEKIVITSKMADLTFTTLRANDTINATLFDLQGRKAAELINGTYSGHQVISKALTGLKSGMYILQASVNNKSVLSEKYLIE